MAVYLLFFTAYTIYIRLKVCNDMIVNTSVYFPYINFMLCYWLILPYHYLFSVPDKKGGPGYFFLSLGENLL